MAINFNDNNLTNRPPTDVINMIVIEAWYNWRLAYEFYLNNKYNGKTMYLHDCRARISNLYLTLYELLNRKLKEEELEFLKNICMMNQTSTEADILKAYLIINRVLDETQLIRVDTKRIIDRSNIEESNKAYGY